MAYTQFYYKLLYIESSHKKFELLQMTTDFIVKI